MQTIECRSFLLREVILASTFASPKNSILFQEQIHKLNFLALYVVMNLASITT